MSKKAKTVVGCGFCTATVPRDRDSLSAFTHSHPSVCPYRQDKMPSLNGVHVGDLWRNLHTAHVVRVVECRLGGAGTYTDREPVYVTESVWSRSEEDGTLDALVEPTLAELAAMPGDDDGFGGALPMWSLAEHWEPLTRPGDWPVPWEPDERFENGRSAVEAWRCPSHRGQSSEDGAYFHAFHRIDGAVTTGWEWWQTDGKAPRQDSAVTFKANPQARSGSTTSPAEPEQLALAL